MLENKGLIPLEKINFSRNNSLTGFTLMELMVVLIIIGILATLGLNYYGSYKEAALDREAKANLRLIIVAQRDWKMDKGSYYASGVISDINNNLRLLLSNAGDRSWDYLTKAYNTSPPSTCAQATRFNGPDSRTFNLPYTQSIAGGPINPIGNPVAGDCPP